MDKNPFNDLYMHMDVETKEWTGAAINNCSMCQKEIKYPIYDQTEDNMMLVLTYVERAYLDSNKCFCSYKCFEKWIADFITNNSRIIYE